MTLGTIIRIKIRGIGWRIRFVKASEIRGKYGDCDPPGVKNPLIRLWYSMRGKQALEHTLHEPIHAAVPHMAEEDVIVLARAQTELLWKLGYRLVQSDPTEKEI